MENFICKYCGKQCKNLNSLTQHEIRCKLNPNKIDMSYIKLGHSIGHKGSNQYIKAKQLGLSKPIISEETKIKLGKGNKNRKMSITERNKRSEAMKLAVIKHPNSYNGCNINGKVPVIDYNGIKLNGSWEVIVAKYLDANNIKWIRPTKGILYLFNNKQHLYYPDFYLIDYNYYIEVKGYETQKDLIKYQHVKNLVLIKKHEIEQIEKNEYNLKTYILY